MNAFDRATPPTIGNPTAAKAHLEKLFSRLKEEYAGGLIEIRCISAERNTVASQFSSIDEAVDFAFEHNVDQYNAYVGVNPRKPGTFPGAAASTEDVEIAFFNFADLDKNESCDILRAGSPIPYSFAVTTGRTPSTRVHVYWELEDGQRNLKAWSETQRGIKDYFQGDAVIDPPRIMRLAGTVNYPSADKATKGYIQETVIIQTEYQDGRGGIVSPIDLRSAFPLHAYQPDDRGVATPSLGGPLNLNSGIDVGAATEKIKTGKEWHNNVVRVVGKWVTQGLSDPEILARSAEFTIDGYTEADTMKEVRAAIEGARKKGWAPALMSPTNAEPGTGIRAVPFKWLEPSEIPVRKWIYGQHFIRKYISVTGGVGGVGKTSVEMVEAVAIVTGRPLLDVKPRESCHVWYVNLEDPADEIHRRLMAICFHYGIKREEIEGRLFLTSGRDARFTIAKAANNAIEFVTPNIEAIGREIVTHNIGVLMIDPFVKLHRVPENSNDAIDAVVTELARIADDHNLSIDLNHHLKKGDGDEPTADDLRGASALIGAVRSARIVVPMTTKEARKADIEEEHRRRYIRVVDAKGNMAPPAEHSSWKRLESVDLGNGTGFQKSDNVGVATIWKWPDPFDGVTTAHGNEIRKRVANGDYRQDAQSPDWVGKLVAEVMDFDLYDDADKAKVKSIVKMYVKNDVLKVERRPDKDRKMKPFIVCGGSIPGEIH